jgi:hypothetical protein
VISIDELSSSSPEAPPVQINTVMPKTAEDFEREYEVQR